MAPSQPASGEILRLDGQMHMSPSWRDDIKVHPAADLFPMMSEVELDELAADIASNGLHHGVVWVGAPGGLALLDGRNRLAAIARIADEKRRAELQTISRGRLFEILPSSEDPTAYVISANLHRRHLTREQKHDVIAALLKVNPAQSDRAVAKMAKVDHKTVAAVRTEAEAGGEIPHVANRTDTKGRQQPAKKTIRKTPLDNSVRLRVERQLREALHPAPDDRPQLLNGSKSVTSGNIETLPTADPVDNLLATVDGAVANFTIEQQKRLGPKLEAIGRDLRLYAGLSPALAARRKANAARKARSIAKSSKPSGDKTEKAPLAAQEGDVQIG
jgi:hypothetical protein